MTIIFDGPSEEYKELCRERWEAVLEMVQDVAPEDAKVIAENPEVCFKVFAQGIYAGWNAGAANIVSKLANAGIVEEHKVQ